MTVAEGAVPIDPDQLVPAVQGLTGEISALRTELAGAKESLTTQRKVIKWLIISLILHVPITLALGAFSVVAYTAADTANGAAQTSQAAQVSACQSSNTYRIADLKRWQKIENFVLSLDPSDVRTQQFVAAIDKQNVAADALRNCTNPGKAS